MAPYRNLKQTITHWEYQGSDGYGGTNWGSPTEMAGWWQDENRLFRDAEGQERASEAIVLLEKDVGVGDMIYLGSSTASDPTTLSSSREVRRFDKVPSVRILDYDRVAYL